MKKREADLPFGLPGTKALSGQIDGVLGGEGASDPLEILSREPNAYRSTFASEVVTCRRGEGEVLRIFCKYASTSHRRGDYRGGLAYEAQAYRRVLPSIGLSTPKFVGFFGEAGGSGQTLMIEHIDKGLRVTKSPDRDAIVRAAEWIACFHARGEVLASRRSFPFLRVHDHAYYEDWTRRALAMARQRGGAERELAAILRGGDKAPVALCSPPLTIIHGEFYPNNILVQKDRVCPVDWESVALGDGCLDLATLTEGWDRETIRKLEEAYAKARWATRPPDRFSRNLAAARIHLRLRYLSYRRTGPVDYAHHLQELGDQVRTLASG